MVANGLIFCLDVASYSFNVVKELSDTNEILPPIPRAIWSLPELDLDDCLEV